MSNLPERKGAEYRQLSDYDQALHWTRLECRGIVPKPLLPIVYELDTFQRCSQG